MEKFIAKITPELKTEIMDFLNKYKDPIVDYWVWRRALELYRLANDEIKKSVEAFGKEFDSIIEYYNTKHKDDEFSYAEQLLINETNNKLESLYRRYVIESETKLLLNQLMSKKYESYEVNKDEKD